MAATKINMVKLCIKEELSVPLSSGQWLQQSRRFQGVERQADFQSPCHRVNGCNAEWERTADTLSILSVPLSSGQWLQPGPSVPGSCLSPLSVPLSSGQWLQLIALCSNSPLTKSFQSPCHRVNGCNAAAFRKREGRWPAFQSPCHRVNGCNESEYITEKPPCFFQSPCHRVNGCNRAGPDPRPVLKNTFSPLVIGSMAAT